MRPQGGLGRGSCPRVWLGAAVHLLSWASPHCGSFPVGLSASSGEVCAPRWHSLLLGIWVPPLCGHYDKWQARGLTPLPSWGLHSRFSLERLVQLVIHDKRKAHTVNHQEELSAVRRNEARKGGECLASLPGALLGLLPGWWPPRLRPWFSALLALPRPPTALVTAHNPVSPNCFSPA